MEGRELAGLRIKASEDTEIAEKKRRKFTLSSATTKFWRVCFGVSPRAKPYR